jgi:arylsulfatase A-like enzyme
MQRFFALVALLLAPLAELVAAEPTPTRPNIIFILADDLGIGDLGAYGQQKIRTPNIDRIAAEGMRFTGFYSGQCVCAPSRCTLMTGKHTGHSVVRNNAQRAGGDEGQVPMPPGTITVAQLLKQAGYATAIVGKWGLGMPEDKSSPLDFGFDHHYGYLCQGVAHTYYPPYLWRDNVKEMLEGNPPYDLSMHGVIPPTGKTYSADLIDHDGLSWVRAHKDAPFFLYFASTIPHLSLQVPDDSLVEYKGKWPETPFRNTKHYANNENPRATYAAMITRFDRDVGLLLDLLNELKLADNTLVFFSSDNGAVFPLAGTDPVFFGSTGGLRGYKQDLYEGGIRTPFLARWPNHIKAGSTNDFMGAFWDVLPTFCEFAGVVPPTDIDGISIWPTLLGQPGQRQHDHLYWEYHSGGSAQAVRFGEWKAIRNGVKKAPDSIPELYNLKSDPAETANVAAAHPELAAKAAALMKSARTPSARPEWNF